MFKINQYFDGKVASIAFQTATLPATVGVMAVGRIRVRHQPERDHDSCQRRPHRQIARQQRLENVPRRRSLYRGRQ